MTKYIFISEINNILLFFGKGEKGWIFNFLKNKHTIIRVVAPHETYPGPVINFLAN